MFLRTCFYAIKRGGSAQMYLTSLIGMQWFDN